MRGANLERADLTDADFYRADLSGANLCSADFNKANLTGANLSGAVVKRANFLKANLSDANFTGCSSTLYREIKYLDLSGGHDHWRYQCPFWYLLFKFR